MQLFLIEQLVIKQNKKEIEIYWGIGLEELRKRLTELKDLGGKDIFPSVKW